MQVVLHPASDATRNTSPYFFLSQIIRPSWKYSEYLENSQKLFPLFFGFSRQFAGSNFDELNYQAQVAAPFSRNLNSLLVFLIFVYIANRADLEERSENGDIQILNSLSNLSSSICAAEFHIDLMDNSL